MLPCIYIRNPSCAIPTCTWAVFFHFLSFNTINSVFQQGGLVANDNLYSLNIESKAITVCMAQYPDRVDATNLCVGLVDMPGRDFDPSDAGAPIIYQNFLTGIASFGESVNDDQSPIVTIAVGAFTNWIVQAAN